MIGVLADTHVPDRARRLDPRILERFQTSQVQTILHAGDVSIPGVLAQLAQVAPVYTVRGNRDFFGGKDLPMIRRFEFGGVTIGMAHGHFGWRGYLAEKFSYTAKGYRQQRYRDKLLPLFPDVDVIVFGHSHVPAIWREGEQLLVNPGTAGCINEFGHPPSFALLRIVAGQLPEAELVTLEPPDR